MTYSIETTTYKNKMISFCKRQGVNINLDSPITIQDKLAWLNFYDTDPLKSKCADKIKVHEYCKEVLGEDICIPILGIYNDAKDIDFDKLPKQFVLKCNHGSGMNIIVKDKSTLDISSARSRLQNWMNDDFAFRNGFEAHYHDIERKIFAERFMNDGHSTLHDYKLWCFNGEPIMYTINDGNGHGDIMYYDMNDNEMNLYAVKHHEDYIKPKSFDKMVDIAKKLCKPFKFVRVDLYEIDGKVYLGELTFTPGACAFKYKMDGADIKIGKMLDISK